jgi:hypothetical protein
VVLLSGKHQPDAGKSVWGSGFLPTVVQGVQCRSEGDPVLYASDPPGVDSTLRRRALDVLNRVNERTHREFEDPETITRISQFEMAYRMRISVPEVMDIAGPWTSRWSRSPSIECTGPVRDRCPSPTTASAPTIPTWDATITATRMAGGGLRKGFSHGGTDDIGYLGVEGRVHVHDLRATILHLLGFDHEKLSHRFQGRDFRLTDVHGHVVR